MNGANYRAILRETLLVVTWAYSCVKMVQSMFKLKSKRNLMCIDPLNPIWLGLNWESSKTCSCDCGNWWSCTKESTQEGRIQKHIIIFRLFNQTFCQLFIFYLPFHGTYHEILIKFIEVFGLTFTYLVTLQRVWTKGFTFPVIKCPILSPCRPRTRPPTPSPRRRTWRPSGTCSSST